MLSMGDGAERGTVPAFTTLTVWAGTDSRHGRVERRELQTGELEMLGREGRARARGRPRGQRH